MAAANQQPEVNSETTVLVELRRGNGQFLDKMKIELADCAYGNDVLLHIGGDLVGSLNLHGVSPKPKPWFPKLRKFFSEITGPAAC